MQIILEGESLQRFMANLSLGAWATELGSDGMPKRDHWDAKAKPGLYYVAKEVAKAKRALVLQFTDNGLTAHVSGARSSEWPEYTFAKACGDTCIVERARVAALKASQPIERNKP